MLVQSYTMTRQKALVARLEFYYSHKLYCYTRWQKNQKLGLNKTTAACVDRRFRIELKNIEMLLENLGSKLFQNEQKSSIRQTCKIKAKMSGIGKGK